MTSRGFHYLSQEVIIRPFALKHPREMTPTATMLCIEPWVLSAVGSLVGRLLTSFDIMCTIFVATISILHASALKWHLFLITKLQLMNAACCSRAPLSAILIWDKNQSSTPENSISLMRYEYSSKHKSEIVCCFQTNPLKVIWSSAANYRAFWAASRLHRTPPPPFPIYPPTAPFSVHHIPSLCLRQGRWKSWGSWQRLTRYNDVIRNAGRHSWFLH